MSTKKDILVYFHINSFTEEVFYVGIGLGYRPYRFSGRSKWWNRIVNKYGFKVRVVHVLDNWDQAKELEIFYIQKYGRMDNKTGVLVNMTDGGDGTLGIISNVGSKRTPEQRKKISDALKGRTIDPELVKRMVAARKKNGYGSAFKGKKHSDESRNKNRLAHLGKTASDETKGKMSESSKGQIFSEEHRRKLSECNKGKVKTEEHKRRLSEATKRQWQEGRAHHPLKAA